MAANLGPGSLLRGGRFRLPADPLISGADEVDQAGDGVEVDGVTGHDDDVVGAGLDVLLPCLHLVGLDGDGALDGPGIAAPLRTPLVEQGDLVGEARGWAEGRPEDHTSELQSPKRTTYPVFC